MYTIIYILSISFQLAGALLLMIFALSTKREKIIQQFAGKGLIYRDNNTDKLSLTKRFLEKHIEMLILTNVLLHL